MCGSMIQQNVDPNVTEQKETICIALFSGTEWVSVYACASVYVSGC